MNFIAGFMLMHMPGEEDAFVLLVRTLQHPKYGLRGCFLRDLPDVGVHSYVIRELLREQLPSLAGHLEGVGVTPLFWFEWYFALYTLQLPPPVVRRLPESLSLLSSSCGAVRCGGGDWGCGCPSGLCCSLFLHSPPRVCAAIPCDGMLRRLLLDRVCIVPLLSGCQLLNGAVLFAALGSGLCVALPRLSLPRRWRRCGRSSSPTAGAPYSR
jgi:hypothetical protein